MSNKDVLGQEVLLFDGIASIVKLLDQLSDGLCSLEVLRVMHAFPDVTAPLHVHCVTSSDVQDAVYIDKEKKQMSSLVIRLCPIFITS